MTTISEFANYNTIGLICEKGGGKTIKMASQANKMKKFIFCDALGVLDPRRDYRSGVIPNTNYFTKRLTRKENREITTSAVDVFINEVKRIEYETKSKRHIIDFADSKTRPEDMIKLLNWLEDEARLRNNAYALLIDECQLFFPQREHAPREAVEFVQSCRNWGITPVVMATQRPQSTDKAILELADVYYLGAQLGFNTVSHLTTVGQIDQETLNSMPKRSFYNTDTKTVIKTPNYKYAHKQNPTQ